MPSSPYECLRAWINHVHTHLVGLGGVGWCDRTTVAQWEPFWILDVDRVEDEDEH